MSAAIPGASPRPSRGHVRSGIVTGVTIVGVCGRLVAWSPPRHMLAEGSRRYLQGSRRLR
jgi:hypothetical protein